MNIGEAGIALVKSFEQCRLSAYLPTPGDVPTIGWGRTKGVSLGDTCTQDQADMWLVDDLAWAEACVNRAVTAQLTQNEFDACTSLCFNIGCPAFSGSTLVKLLNNADYDGASEQFARWNHQKGVVLAGLTKRRQAEENLFDTA